MEDRICCACREEPVSDVVSFHLLKTGYPVGPACHESWCAEARALGKDIDNPARVNKAFNGWLKTRARA